MNDGRTTRQLDTAFDWTCRLFSCKIAGRKPWGRSARTRSEETTMKTMTSLSLCLTLIPAVAAATDLKPGDLANPVEILKKADAAAKAVKSVRFHVSAEGTGALASRLGKISGSVVMSGYSNGTAERFHFDFQVMMPGAKEAKRVTGGSDKENFFIVDHEGKTAYEDIDPSVMGPVGRMFGQATMIEFLHPEPFSDEINGKSHELKGGEKIGGEDCHVVHVVYAAQGAPSATWSFSKKDFLPRRRVDSFVLPDGTTGSSVKTITDLVVDPKLDDKMFKLELPKGYKKVDDFAPDFLTPS